jgi:glycosyltransferase involved in cell wall biosynthesis
MFVAVFSRNNKMFLHVLSDDHQKYLLVLKTIIMHTQTLKSQSTDSTNCLYSVILPAYNEEALLGTTLADLHLAMASVSCKGEIIVVDNNSSDNTKNIARECGARVVFESVRQIAKARNRGARAAQGDYLVFLDADTTLTPELLQSAITLLATGRCCGGGTLLSYDTKLPLLAATLVACWNWISKTCRFAAGSFIFCLARGFKEIGGFDEHIYAGEEVVFSRRMKSWSEKNNMQFTIIDDQAVLTSSRKFVWYSSIRITALLLLFTIFPLGLRYRTLCNFWYRRPPAQ